MPAEKRTPRGKGAKGRGKGKGNVKTRSRHSVEEVDLDSGSNFPHVPMHGLHLEEADSTDSGKSMGKSSSLYADRYNIAVLMFLYVLQGIPLGLAGSIPYLLQSREVSYKDQAIFSFVFWPFSVKLIWAPIVDSVYMRSFGRRKSWLIPTQYLIGLFMMVLSLYTPYLMGEESKDGHVNVLLLTVIFFCLNFFAATQDIAVDGWALTMLSRRNVGWASTCNTVGQTAGFFLGNIVFMALESPDFCNYLRAVPSKEGFVTLSGFLYFWGIVFLVTTTLVWWLKHEAEAEADDEYDPDTSVVDTYQLLWKIINLQAVKSLIGILLTVKIGFAAADAITGLKLIEEGVPKETLALLGVPLVPIQIILPLIISKYTTGPNPMDIFLKAMPYRLFMGIVFAAIVWWAPSTRSLNGDYPMSFYAVVLVAYALHQVALYCMFVAIMGFHAKISDPKIGGSYMTLLNTFANLGGNWPSTIALYLVESLTYKSCEDTSPEHTPPGGLDLTCSTPEAQKACKDAEGTCITSLDGYYILSAVCLVIGFAWLYLRSRRVRELQALPPSAWTCSTS